MILSPNPDTVIRINHLQTAINKLREALKHALDHIANHKAKLANLKQNSDAKIQEILTHCWDELSPPAKEKALLVEKQTRGEVVHQQQVHFLSILDAWTEVGKTRRELGHKVALSKNAENQITAGAVADRLKSALCNDPTPITDLDIRIHEVNGVITGIGIYFTRPQPYPITVLNGTHVQFPPLRANIVVRLGARKHFEAVFTESFSFDGDHYLPTKHLLHNVGRVYDTALFPAIKKAIDDYMDIHTHACRTTPYLWNIAGRRDTSEGNFTEVELRRPDSIYDGGRLILRVLNDVYIDPDSGRAASNLTAPRPIREAMYIVKGGRTKKHLNLSTAATQIAMLATDPDGRLSKTDAMDYLTGILNGITQNNGGVTRDHVITSLLKNAETYDAGEPAIAFLQEWADHIRD